MQQATWARRHMPQFTRVVVVAYLLFNIAIVFSPYFAPGSLDAQYAATALTLWMKNASERRSLIFANAGVYFLDAFTQWSPGGRQIRLEVKVLHTNGGTSFVVGGLLIIGAQSDAARATTTSGP